MFKTKKITNIEELKLFIKTTDSKYMLINKDHISNLTVFTFQDDVPLALLEFDCKQLCIQYFEVSSYYRNKGYGNLIINALLSELRKLDISHVCVVPSGEKSEQFWRKCGFVNYTSPMLIYRLNY